MACRVVFVQTCKLPDPESTTNLEFQKVCGYIEETIPNLKFQNVRAFDWTIPNLEFLKVDPLINDPFTKIKSDNLYGRRPSLPDGLMIAPDVIISVKVAVVCGYGDVGKGYAAGLKVAGARVIVTEIDPFLEPPMEDLPVEDVVGTADIFVTATGNKYIIMVDHMRKMKNNAIVCNIADFDNNFYMQGFEFKPQTDKWVFPDTNSGIIALSEGRLMNLGCATGHPNFVMSGSFTKKAAYVNVPVEGPYKTAQYRY